MQRQPCVSKTYSRQHIQKFKYEFDLSKPMMKDSEG